MCPCVSPVGMCLLLLWSDSRLRGNHLLLCGLLNHCFLCQYLLIWDTVRNDILWLCFLCDSLVRNRFLVTCTKMRSMLAPSAYSGEHLSCASSSFSMLLKALPINVDKIPWDLSPTVYFNPFFSSTLSSTFVTFLDTHISSSALGFFLSVIFCHPSRRSGPRYVPAIGYALFTSCKSALLARCTSTLFYQLYVHSFNFFSSGSSICTCLPSLLAYSLSGVAVCECVSLAVHTVFRSGALVCQGLAFSRRTVRPSTYWPTCSLCVVQCHPEPLTPLPFTRLCV